STWTPRRGSGCCARLQPVAAPAAIGADPRRAPGERGRMRLIPFKNSCDDAPMDPASEPGRHGVVRDRLQSIVHGAALALIIGWVLYIGRPVIVPMEFGVIAAYMNIGMARAAQLSLAVRERLPRWLRYTASIFVILVAITA